MRSTSSPDQINLVFDIEPEPAPPAVKVEAVEVRPQPMPVDLPESAWGPLDRKILESAVKPIAGSVLYDKSRHSNLGRKYFYTRRDYLVAQGKLHTWTEEPSNGRPTTYYCVNPPSKPDPSSIIADVEVAAEAVDPPGAIDLYTKKQFRQSAMAGFGDSRPMEEVFSGLSVKDLFWAQWQDTKWMTTNEVAAFLGLTPRAIDKNFQRNRDEFIEAGEVQKLEKQALRDFRDATDSESVASGEHGIPARASQSRRLPTGRKNLSSYSKRII